MKLGICSVTKPAKQVSLKQGTYAVRGTIGPSRTAPVMASVYESDGSWYVGFDYNGAAFTYRPRALSPHPERLAPKRVALDVQPTATSIAREALRAAQAAFDEDARVSALVAKDEHQDNMTLDDIVLGGIAARSMGVAQ